MKFDRKKVDSDILKEILSMTKEPMLSPFKKKKVIEIEAVPEDEEEMSEVEHEESESNDDEELMELIKKLKG